MTTTAAHEQLCTELGLTYQATIADRRGSWLIQATRPDGREVALKASDPNVTDTYDRSALLAHEAVVLWQLDWAGRDQLVDSGVSPKFGQWLQLRWINGQTASEVAKPLRSRKGKERNRAFTDLALRIIQAYFLIHRRGVLHGDVQPAHLLFEPRWELPVILDFGLARTDTAAPYKGALVHFASPEVAQAMLNGASTYYTLPQEVYSIGALLYYLMTGETAINYGGEPDRFQHQLEAVATGRLRDFSSPQTALEKVIMACLSSDPAQRPVSMTAIAKTLQ